MDKSHHRFGRRDTRSTQFWRLQEHLAADLKAHGLEKWHFYLRISHPELAYQRLLRLTECSMAYKNPIARLVSIGFRVRLKIVGTRIGVAMPAGVAGPGLSLAHLGATVVNDKARIGKYCRLHTSTNIGEYKGEAPSIGDFVYIGPGVVIYGGVVIGDMAVIGANSVVNHDVPAGVTVAGNPARIISESSSYSVMPPWIQDVVSAQLSLSISDAEGK